MTDATSTFSRISSIDDLYGPAGRLEAVLNSGSPNATYAAIICHPHPKGGGTMHNKVVYHAMKAFSSLGLPVVRFNFRGVGLSEGEHDEGHGEQEDVRAVLNWIEQHLNLPILFAGFSFGSSVGLRACCGDPRVKGLVGLGVPVRAEGRDYSYGFLPQCAGPKLFISGDHDQYGPRELVEEVLQKAAEPKEIHWVAGADHFFQGTADSPTPKLDQMQEILRRWLGSHFGLN
ncbi:alpha/beta fold hydrolase [Granulicella sp. dw_53]|uniref:alpha/beta hydrolase n=1 Tax=Granulicella sp. dw_53 TaxID=2719792 RepID=UPI001BD20FE7|nr:alpha/beta fold hydrolase [Granulicella sp. dw_53]